MTTPPTNVSVAAAAPGAGKLTAAQEDAIIAAAVADVVTSVTPAGTTQATATPLTGTTNILPSTPAGSGVILAATNPRTVTVVNTDPANAVLVYPPTGAQFRALGANNPVQIQAGGLARFVQQSATQFWLG